MNTEDKGASTHRIQQLPRVANLSPYLGAAKSSFVIRRAASRCRKGLYWGQVKGLGSVMDSQVKGTGLGTNITSHS